MVKIFLDNDTEKMAKFDYITQEYIDRALREDPLPWPEYHGPGHPTD